MAREAGTSAALTARTVLEEWLSLQREEGEGRVDDKVVKQQVTGRLLEGLVSNFFMISGGSADEGHHLTWGWQACL